MPLDPPSNPAQHAENKIQTQPPAALPAFDIELILDSGRISEIATEDHRISGQSLQLRYASEQNAEYPFTFTPVQPQRAIHKITLTTGTAPPSEARDSDQTFSDTHLQRSAEHGVPMRLSSSHFPDLKGVAGTPLTGSISSPFKPRLDPETGKLCRAENLDELQQLSPFSSHYSFGPLPTPVFDSTGRIMRIPELHPLAPDANCSGRSMQAFYLETEDDYLPWTDIHSSYGLVCSEDSTGTLSMSGVPSLSTGIAPSMQMHTLDYLDAVARPDDTVNTPEDSCAHRWDFATPRPRPMQYDMLEKALQGHEQPKPVAACVLNSAPPVLYRSLDEKSEIEARAAWTDFDAPLETGGYDAVQLVASQDVLQ